MSAPGSVRAEEGLLWTPEAGQWVATTTGRIASDGYGWMQAVHWVADGGRYRPRRAHGPAFGDTTVRIANELVRFSPCRPGVDHLAHRLGLSERTVQYHLQMLRQAGLLAYVQRGTRVRAEGRRASEFARIVPAAFDRCLGVRVVGSGVRRRPVGMAEAGRAEMAALGRKAVRSARRRRSRPGRRRARARCTPMGVTTPALSPAGNTRPPSEAKLGHGKTPTSTSTSTHGNGGRLNAVGHRFRLAAELVRRVGWLGRSSVPRIAWIVRHVADAGWTADEVLAWLHARGEADVVRRPSGLLATLLQGAETLLDTPQKRAMAVEDWRDSRAAGERRRRGWLPATNAPRSRAVRELVTTALVPRPRTDLSPALAAPPAPLDGRPLAPAHAALLRETARAEFMLGDSTLVRSAVRAWGSERAAEVYGEELVRRVIRLARTTALLTLAGPGAAS
ncbi:winged helix-turn-helix domain-containing protein [Streptomyces sp. NPDC059193]|uniref:helix-turn-helix domain-containing protein n=1 Tax=Streptomyces sp. NPDC059193 TaxID=3346763 RepID=UPI00369669F4